MGYACNSSICSQDVNFEQVQMKISKKNCETLERFGQGALARREANRRRIQFIRQITGKQSTASTDLDLLRPTYVGENAPHLTYIQGDPLIPFDELERFLSSEQGGQRLIWLNYFQDIKEDLFRHYPPTHQPKRYKGQWRADMSAFEGIGILLFPDGSTYKGQTKHGMFNGKGRMTHANGDIYQGEWHNGKANGFGVFVDTNGSMYEGYWMDDQQHGYGTESWNYSKIKYIGDFYYGKKTGKGKFEFEGGFYEGDFVDGMFHGFGKYYFADTGKVYEGEFANNNMEGRGTLTWPDQSRYEGDFLQGRMEGKGTKFFANGNKYIGDWQADSQHGSGVLYNVKEQTKRQGKWTNGKRTSWLSSPRPTHISSFKGNRNSVGSSPNSTFMRSRHSAQAMSSNK